MRRAVVVMVLLLGALIVAPVSSAQAEDGGGHARRDALRQAGDLVEQALTKLRAGDAQGAAELLAKARAAAPGEPVVAYDEGVALARADRTDEAREAYRRALAAGPDASVAGDGVPRGARHNLGTMSLLSARDAAALLRTPGALESAVRAHGAPGGEPLTPDTVTMLAEELRGKTIQEGLRNARAAVEALRENVRTDPSDAAAVRNLVLAQRARRFLEEQEKQQQRRKESSGDSDRQDENDQQQKGEDQSGQGGADDEQQAGEEQQQSPGGEDERQTPDAKDDSGSAGEQQASDGDDAQAKPAEPRDVGREEAEHALEQILDAAERKARQVERMKAARLRRAPVEKDW